MLLTYIFLGIAAIVTTTLYLIFPTLHLGWILPLFAGAFVASVIVFFARLIPDITLHAEKGTRQTAKGMVCAHDPSCYGLRYAHDADSSDAEGGGAFSERALYSRQQSSLGF